MTSAFTNMDILIFYFFMMVLFWVLYVLQLSIYLLYYRASLLFRKKHEVGKAPGVSVIICAHNEAANLKENLSFILEQVYHGR